MINKPYIYIYILAINGHINHINTCGGEFSYKPVLNARESLSLQLGHGDGDLVLDLVGQ